MRIGILTRNSMLYSTRRLWDTAESRGHSVTIIDTLHLSLRIQRYVRLGLPVPRHILPAVDALIPRIGTSVTHHGVTVVGHFERRGVVSTASASGILNSRNKLDSMAVMARADLPYPPTIVLESMAHLPEAVRAVGGYPVVLKPNRGTQGQGVMLAPNAVLARRMVNLLALTGQRILVQAFVAEAAGRDMRVIVVGDQCIAVMQRNAAAGDFRANLHLGGTARATNMPPEVAELALAAAQAHKLRVAGVDLVKGADGYLLLEVNSSPGLEGIEKATAVDVAEAVVALLETEVTGRRKRARRRRRKRAR